MYLVTQEEATARLGELIDEGEEILITRAGKQVAKIVPVTDRSKTFTPQLGTAAGRGRMAADFDATPEEFAEYL